MRSRYQVLSLLGSGTFGQVVKCCHLESGELVAIKVIKSHAAYHHQARVEMGILNLLNTRADPDDKAHIVRLHDYFMHAPAVGPPKHLCLVFGAPSPGWRLHADPTDPTGPTQSCCT